RLDLRGAESGLVGWSRPDSIEAVLRSIVQGIVAGFFVEGYEERGSCRREGVAVENIGDQAVEIVIAFPYARAASSPRAAVTAPAPGSHVVAIVGVEPREARGRGRVAVVDESTIRDALTAARIR